MLSYALFISILTLLTHLCQNVYMGTHTYTISGTWYSLLMPIVVKTSQTATLSYNTQCSRLTVQYYNCCTMFAKYEHYSSGLKNSHTWFVVGTDFIQIKSPSNGCSTFLTLILDFDCGTIDSKCDDCNSYNSCTSCITGYYVSPNNPICKPCTATNCVQCLGSSTCAICSPGYALNPSNQCATCATFLPSCQSCTSNTTCTACTSNSVAISALGGCYGCQIFAGMDKCQTCSNNSTCIACLSTQYTLNTASKCVICSSFTDMQNCNTCTSNTTCTTCISNLFALNAAAKCVSCSTFSGMQHCITCSSNNTCINCLSDQYALDLSFKCYLCSTFTDLTNCQTCLNRNTCTACSSTNYALDAAAKCSLCSSFSGMTNCQTCSGNATCILCSSTSYAIDANAKCAVCSSFAGMSDCLTCSSNTTCLTCVSTNYALDAALKCNICSSFTDMSNCQTCSSNTTCTGCVNTDYALNAAAKCAICSTFADMSNCQTCSNNNTCTMCSSLNYALNAASKCALCSTFTDMTNCQTCTSNSICTACVNTNYALNAASKCNLCSTFATMSNCQSCTDNATCTACSSTNYALDAAAKCSLCSSFSGMTNCQTCSGNATCTSCSSTSYALDANAKCAVCSSFTGMTNCQVCSNNITCTGCSSTNYALDALNRCALCSIFAGMTNCQTCSNNNTCTACSNTNYVLNSFHKCELCSVPLSNCITCSSPTVCTSCETGYALNSLSKCLACITFLSNCLTCSSNATCLTCEPGFEIEAGKCKPCSQLFSHCSWCTSNTSCFLCDPGFTLESGRCKTCQTYMIHCSQCSSQTTCTACFDPYDVGTDQKCTTCKAPLFYVSKLCIDDANCVSAYKKSNKVMCSFCDMSKHYILDESRKCVCKKGFHSMNSGCQQICGDGLIYISECDDKNTNDNDGCSSSCKLEADFLCTNGLLGVTKCKLNKNVVLKLDFVEKIISDNKALIYISLNSDNPNVHAYYRSILFDYNITSNRSETITILSNSMNQQGQIVIQIEYLESIEDSMMQLSFMYEKQHLISQDHVLRFQLKGKNYALVISGFVDKYQEIYDISVYVVICFYLFVIVFLLSDKFIAVEGLNSLQMIYFSLLLIYKNGDWPQAFSTVLPLKYSMGFNQMIYEEKSFANIADLTFNKYRYLNMCESFLMNNLTNSAILMVLSVAFIILYVIKTKMEQAKNQTKEKAIRRELRRFFRQFRKVYKKFYNITFHFSYIMLFQLFVSLYIETAYMKSISLPMKILSKFCGMWLFVTIIFTVMENFNHFFLSYEDTVLELFRVGKIQARYKAVYLSYLLINVVCIVLLNNKLFFGLSVSVFLLFLAFIYLIFLILYRPYRYSFTVHTFTILANQLIYMLTLGLITLVNMEVKLQEEYLLMFCYTLLGFCIIMALLTVVRVYLDFRFGAAQVQEEVSKEIKEIEEIERNSFVKQPQKQGKQIPSDQINQANQNPYKIENQVLVQEQIDFLNELMKKKFLSQWERDQAYYRHYKTKPLMWVQQNQKQAKYEYLLQKETEALENNIYKKEIDRKKEQKAKDRVYTEELKDLKNKLRIEYQARKQMEQKANIQKKRKRKPEESPQKSVQPKRSLKKSQSILKR